MSQWELDTFRAGSEDSSLTERQRNWFRAAVEVETQFAGRERQCPRCSVKFVSKFNRGKCPACGHMFFASNPECGSDGNFRVPGFSLKSDPTIFASYSVQFYAINLEQIGNGAQQLEAVAGSRAEQIRETDNRLAYEIRENRVPQCRDAIRQILEGTADTSAVDAFAMYIYALEIICDALGNLLLPTDDTEIHDLADLPHKSLAKPDKPPVAIPVLKKHFPRISYLRHDQLAAELICVSSTPPVMKGGSEPSEYLAEQMTAYADLLRQAAALGHDLVMFRY